MTPEDAIRNLSDAYAKGDKRLFLSTICVEESGREYAEARFHGIAATVDFANEIEKAYGREEGMHYRGDLPVFTDEELAKMEIKVEGDKATVNLPWHSSPRTLIRKDGCWKVDMNDDIPSGAKRVEDVKRFKAIITAIAEVRGKIGKDGMTKDQIVKELVEAQRKAGIRDGWFQ
jgi:hypothetical protein